MSSEELASFASKLRSLEIENDLRVAFLHLRDLIGAVEDARTHISEDLQPAFQRLADGKKLPWPKAWKRSKYDQRQAAQRLATWWHNGDGRDPLLEDVREFITEASDHLKSEQ